MDNGLEKYEFDSVLHQYQDMGLNVKGVDKDRFYAPEFLTPIEK